jgi:protein-serine/threonine kinase
VEKYGKCQEVLGSGASGTVWVLRKNLEIEPREELYAVKQLRRTPDETENAYRKRVTATFCISSELQHPNVIRTVDLLHEPKECSYKVMELCTGGNLFMRLQSATKLEVQEADCFFKQLMSGVEYIHQMGVAHRDLKPENLLLTRHGRLKICDFDYSECFRMAWEDDVHMVSGLCGSEPYVAPEAFIEKEFDGRATDVWACGIIYMAMRIGRFLWNIAKKDEDDLYAQYLGDRRHEDGFLPIEGFPGVSVIIVWTDPLNSCD